MKVKSLYQLGEFEGITAIQIELKHKRRTKEVSQLMMVIIHQKKDAIEAYEESKKNGAEPSPESNKDIQELLKLSETASVGKQKQ